MLGLIFHLMTKKSDKKDEKTVGILWFVISRLTLQISMPLILGFFNAIQSLQRQSAAEDIDDLMKAGETAFEELHPSKLGDTFLTLQNVMECVMDFNGGNDYKIPHLNKQVRRRAG